MSDYTKYLTSQVALGKMSRREFIGRAAAFGVTLAVAGTMFDSAAEAQEPKRGGNLKLGLEGAATTDLKDPAKAISQFMLVVGRNWGDTVVESDPLTGKAVPALAEFGSHLQMPRLGPSPYVAVSISTMARFLPPMML